MRDDGFTLIELSVAMAVFLVFMTLVTPFMVSHLRSALRTEDQVDVQQGARMALRSMVRELRQASVLYTSPGQPTDGERMSFGVDLNGDGTIVTTEHFTYYVEGGVLRRGRTATSGVPFSQGVESLTFEMFGNNTAFDTNPADGVVTGQELDTNGNGLWEPQELGFVTRVRISLVVASSEDSDDEQAYTAEAFLRNRLAG